MSTRHNTSYKYIPATFFWLMIDVAAPAQVLDQEDLLPPIGATWHMRALQHIPVLPPPERPLVWDLAELIGNDVFGASFAMLPTSAVPGSSAYPEADRVLRKVLDDGGSTHRTYLDVQADKTIELAVETPLITAVYDPGAIMAAYPLLYNAPITGTHCFTSVSPEALTPYCGTTEIEYIRAGQLILNFGTFSNVRLIRTMRSTVSQLDPTDSSMTETLTWYAADLAYPLLQFTTVYYPNGTQARSGLLLDESSVVGIAAERSMAELPLFPNPTTGEVTLTIEEPGVLDVIGADGRSVRTVSFNTAGPRRLDLSDLPNGVYPVIHRGTRLQRVARVVVAR